LLEKLRNARARFPEDCDAIADLVAETDSRISDLEELLDPTLFFRLNRSFIAHFDAIASMVHVSKSRIKIELSPQAKRDIIISSENSQGFKKWLNQ
jgi:DNA-binding LytR/AlgR family response regulator